MCDYEVLCYGQETGLIIEADNQIDALEQIAIIGLKDRGDNLNLVEL